MLESKDTSRIFNIVVDVKDRLNHLKCTKELIETRQPIPITYIKCNTRWRKVKTSFSPSGLRMGCWKGGIHDPTINWIHAVMQHIPYLSGYLPKKWRNGVNMMLENLKGDRRVDKIRTVVIYEVDVNMMNKFEDNTKGFQCIRFQIFFRMKIQVR